MLFCRYVLILTDACIASDVNAPRKRCFLGVSCAHIFCQNQPIPCKQVCSVSDKMHSLERQFIRTFLSINKTGTFYFELYLIFKAHGSSYVPFYIGRLYGNME